MLFVVTLKDIFFIDESEERNRLVEYAIDFVFCFLLNKRWITVLRIRDWLTEVVSTANTGNINGLQTYSFETFLKILVDK